MSSLTPRAGKYLLLLLLVSSSLAPLFTQPTADPSSNAPLCQGAPVLLLFEGGTGAIFWNWHGPDNFSSSQQNPQINQPSGSAAGWYYVTVTDINGLTATGSTYVAIHQSEPIACHDNVEITLGSQGVTTVTPQSVLQGSFEAGFYAVELYDQQGTPIGNQVYCSDEGKTFTFKVYDICNGNYCLGSLHVEDKTPPLLQCEDIFHTCAVADYSPEYLHDVLGITAGMPTASDNCPGMALSKVDAFYDLPCALPINGISISSAWLRRDWRATDAAGNTAKCAQVIYFVRRHLSDVHFPADTTIACPAPSIHPSATGAPFITEYGMNFPLFPNNAYCEINTGYSDEVVPICDGAYKIVRTWTILEDCPNPGEPEFLVHRQLIKVVDNSGPVFTCPPAVSVTIDPFACCAVATLPPVLMRDQCSRINRLEAIIQTFDVWTGDSSTTFGVAGALSDFPNNNYWNPDTLGVFGFTPCLLQGNHTVTYRALDDCGNTATCSFSLVVEDKIPPVVACDTYTQVAIGADGFAEVFATTFDNGSFDQCCNAQFYARRMTPSCNSPVDFSPSVWFCCEDIGNTVQVAFRALDCAENYSDCMVNVEVVDKIRPVCSAPANVTVDCAAFDPTLGSYGYAEGIDNCCLDTITDNANYQQFDSVCNRGAIIRTFKVLDCAGNGGQCNQRIVVDYRQFYYLKMPDDKIINVCDGLGNYGEPVFNFEDCEMLGVSYEDQVFTVVPDGCYRIDRHWRIINWCTYNPNGSCIEVPNPDISQQRPFILPGPIISPLGTLPPWSPTNVLVNPTDTALTNYSVFWSTEANCYAYKQMILVFDTKDPVIQNCPQSQLEICDQTANNSALWNHHDWWDVVTGSHDLCEGPADLSLTASDACTKSEIRFHYLLFLDLDGNGSMETVINSNNPPPPGMVYYNNAFTPNFSGGVLRAFDLRSVPDHNKYQFSIHETVNGSSRSAAVQWKTANQMPFPGNPFGLPGIAPELPYGRHKIKWIVEDGCTNESFCEYSFNVKDCKAPTVVCRNGLSVNLPDTGAVQLWAGDFLQYTEDNCTPTPLIKIAVRKANTGAGFPVDQAGNPITGISFDCSELGSQPVELWSMDLAGNADFCSTFIIVNDNQGICIAHAAISGAVRTEALEGVEDATVQAAGFTSLAAPFQLSGISDQNGKYQLTSVPLASHFVWAPQKNDNPTNGVTTYDLVEISKHILGIKPLKSPYKMIAADANRSNSITGFDIVELRKLVLGIYSELPDNTSWRFVDKSYTFPNSLNPFQETFPESKETPLFTGNLENQDFVAVKIGDVNDSVIPNLVDPNDRNGDDPWAYFTVTPSRAYAQPGERVDFLVQSPEELPAYQFTLQTPGFVLLEVVPVVNCRSDQFALFPDKNAVTVAVDAPGASSWLLRTKADQPGYTAQKISIGSDITPAIGYSADAKCLRPVALHPGSGSLYVETPEPNPFTDKSRLRFYLPQAGEVHLQIRDGNGKVLWSKKQKDCITGMNVIEIDLQGVAAGGCLYYELQTPEAIATGKMLRIN